MGTVKKKLENFFFYYKWHVIIAAAAIALGIVTVRQVLDRIDYDTTISFLGSFGEEPKEVEQFQELLQQSLSDANGDGEVHVFPCFLLVTGEPSDLELDNTSVVHLQGMLMTRETSAMVLGKTAMEELAKSGALEDLTPIFREYGIESESPYGVAIRADNPVFSMFSFGDRQYYLTCLIRGDHMDERQTKDYENAIRLVRMTIEAQQ